MTQIDAWFCKCHAYNKMKVINLELPKGSVFNSTETCRRCGIRQRVKVRVGYF